MEDKVKYWVDLAEYDIGTAEAMLIAKRYLYVGFMCHQAVEKILKGYFYFVKHETPPYIHKLVLLAEKSSLLDSLTEEQRSLLEALQPLNIEARYPAYKERLFEMLTHEKCEQILTQSKEFTQWVKKQLSR